MKIPVFLIDDDLDDQEIFSYVMEKACDQAECHFANDGVHALDKLKSEQGFTPQLIFIDINMPRMNGIECLKGIRELEHMKSVPAYMYSTSAEPEIVQQCLGLGATGFIKKNSDIAWVRQDFERILAHISISV